MPRSAPTRRPRTPLSAERIEAAALAIIDAHGLEDFSLRGLAKALGCEAMSLYHHYPSKAHLLDALVDRVLRGAVIPPRDLPPAQRLRALAQGWREMALKHPRFFPILSVHRMNSETGVSYLNEILRAFRDAGFGEEEAARLFRAVGYYLMGAALDEISGYAKGPSSMKPVSNDILAERFPEIAAAGRYFSPEHFQRTFDLGLERLLGGLPTGTARRSNKTRQSLSPG